MQPGAAVSGKIVRSEELYKQLVLIAPIAPEKIEQIRSWLAVPSTPQPGVKRFAMDTLIEHWNIGTTIWALLTTYSCQLSFTILSNLALMS